MSIRNSQTKWGWIELCLDTFFHGSLIKATLTKTPTIYSFKVVVHLQPKPLPCHCPLSQAVLSQYPAAYQKNSKWYRSSGSSSEGHLTNIMSRFVPIWQMMSLIKWGISDLPWPGYSVDQLKQDSVRSNSQCTETKLGRRELDNIWNRKECNDGTVHSNAHCIHTKICFEWKFKWNLQESKVN